MKNIMMLLLLVCSSFSYASIFDSQGYAEDGLLSHGEHGGLVRVREDSVLTVDGGGANDIDLFDSASLTVLSTSEPYVDYESGISWIVPSDNSNVTVSGGVINYIYVQKNATAWIDGGQVNYIRSIQKPDLGKTITIDCEKDSWSWIGEEDNYTGITGTWHNGEDFTITFLNDTIQNKFPDTWTHVRVIPEPASMILLGLGGIFLKKRRI